MGFNQSASEVDVVVRFLDQKYYQATIADKSSGEDICGEPHQARTVERALAALLAHTCQHLGNPPNLIGAGATQTLGSPLVKRTRGRPKSILPSVASSAVKPKAKRAAPRYEGKGFCRCHTEGNPCSWKTQKVRCRRASFYRPSSRQTTKGACSNCPCE